MADAVWFPEPGRVEIREERLLPLGPSDIRVRAVASGISAGSELLVFRGLAPAGLPPDLPTVGGDFGFPVKFGYASVGIVADVGAEVGAPSMGDLVFVHHPHQTEYVVPADAAIRLSEGTAPEVGTFTANLETAVTVTLDAHPRLAEAVVVTGQGIVGLLITMLLARAGAHPIITVDLHPARREASRQAGAHYAVAPDDDVGGTVMQATNGRGADIAIEASGAPPALQTCIDSVAFAGTIVTASWYGTRDVSLALGGAFHRKRIRVLSSQVSTLDPMMRPRWDRARRMDLVTALLGELPLVELVTHRLPFRDAASAYRLLSEKPHEPLQVVLTYV